MRKKRIILAALLFFSFSVVFGAKGIVVTQKYSSTEFPNANILVTWYVTETQCKMKMEYRDEKANSVTWFIPDMNNGALICFLDEASLNGGAKTYFSAPVSTKAASTATQVSRINLKATGETQVISGMSAEKIVMKTNRNSTEMWLTSDFKPAFYKFYPFFQNSVELMGLNNDNMAGFPLSAITTDVLGKVVSSSEVVSVSQKELSDADFAVPADYKPADSKPAK